MYNHVQTTMYNVQPYTNDHVQLGVVVLGIMCILYIKGCIHGPKAPGPNGSAQALTEKSFRNLIKLTRNQIVFTIFRLIWNQTDVRLDPNQPDNGKYNLISG